MEVHSQVGWDQLTEWQWRMSRMLLGVGGKDCCKMERQFSASEDRSVYDQIKDLLISYAFFPGDRLLVPELADQLRVSATPVREALNRFCAEGLLTAVPHRGFFVKKLNQNEIADLYAVKHMLLSYAVQGTVSQLQLEESERSVLKKLAQLGRTASEAATWLDLYERNAVPMTMLIGSLAENAVLLDCLSNTLDKLHFARRVEVRMEDRAESVYQECAAMSRALLSNQETEIRTWLDQQLQREQAMLPSLMKECVNRLYLRDQPAHPGRAGKRRARLATLWL